MGVKLDTHSVESPAATELYISAEPQKDVPLQEQAEDIFSGIRDILTSKGAYILQERFFAAQNVMEELSQVRSGVYGALDNGVAPSFLVCKEGLSGPFAGVQVYAVICENEPELVKIDNVPYGRFVSLPKCKYLTLSGITALQFDSANEQAKAMLEKAESALKQFDGDIHSVPRTWMWLGDILSWYDDFNKVRNKFFTERGTLGEGSVRSMPASTGIGLGPANGGKCSMDLTAVLEPQNSIQYLQAAGKQQCAFDYGSAFSRASRAVTPAGETVFVSGTASIDLSGATTNIDDAEGQIRETIRNVRAVLKDMNTTDEDVAQVMAYCKTTEVERIFNSIKDDLAWPWITMICDVCRPDLLFEIEATAIPRS
ncbi:MAG: Rid family hydrolase [Planctomycetota bacterium]|jgi:enamine deaminase RidA (YjgF/YER057c/UK114 family)